MTDPKEEEAQELPPTLKLKNAFEIQKMLREREARRLSLPSEKPKSTDEIDKLSERQDRREQDRHDQLIASLRNDRELRCKFEFKIFWLLAAQLLIVHAGVIAMAWFKVIKLETPSLSVWIGGTIAQTVGIVMVVAKNLFPQDQEPPKKRRR